MPVCTKRNVYIHILILHIYLHYTYLGNWGSERKTNVVKPIIQSSTRATYINHNENEKKENRDAFKKFNDAKNKNPMLLSYSEISNHMNNKPESYDENRFDQTTTARSMNVRIFFLIFFYLFLGTIIWVFF